MANPLLAPVMRWLSRLSFPRLFMLAAGLFVVDLVVPDMIPFIDEILLGLGTLLLANLRDGREPSPRETVEGESRRTRSRR